MAKQSLTTIKNWFKTRLKPTQAQYWDTWDSFWHKDQKIPTSSIQNLDAVLLSKASQQYVENVEAMMQQLTADNYVETADLDENAKLTLSRTNNLEPLEVQFSKVSKTGSYNDLLNLPQTSERLEEFSFEFRDVTEAGQIYELDMSAYYKYKVLGTTLKTDTGEINALFSINNQPITGLNCNVTNVKQHFQATNNNHVIVDDLLKMTIVSIANDVTTITGKIKLVRE